MKQLFAIIWFDIKAGIKEVLPVLGFLLLLAANGGIGMLIARWIMPPLEKIDTKPLWAMFAGGVCVPMMIGEVGLYCWICSIIKRMKP